MSESAKQENFFLKWIKFALKFVFAFGIIGYLVYSGRLDLEVVKNGFMNPRAVAMAFGLIIIAAMVTFYRWSMLLRAQGIVMPFMSVVRYAFIGIFFNTTMPGAVSGDMVKAWYMISDRPEGQEKTPILTSIIIDRMMGLFGLITVSMIALIMYWGSIWSVPSLRSIASVNLMLGCGVFTFFAYVMLSNWGPFRMLRNKLEVIRKFKAGNLFLKAYDTWLLYRKKPTLFYGALLAAVCTHICIINAILFVSRALGENTMATHQYFLLAPIGLLSTAIPIAPAGLGVGHVAFAALFKSAGSNLGAEIFTLYVTMQIIINLSGVFFYIRSPKPRPQKQSPSLAS